MFDLFLNYLSLSMVSGKKLFSFFLSAFHYQARIRLAAMQWIYYSGVGRRVQHDKVVDCCLKSNGGDADACLFFLCSDSRGPHFTRLE
jgi:hypothetical protein